MIDIPPEVKRINRQLKDHFGIDTSTGKQIWRVVWTDDQYEKRLVEFTENGIALLYPQVMEMPKYDYLPHKWLLEQLVVVPEINQSEIPENKLSYEPMFPFQTDKGEALPPNFEAAKFVIDAINAVKGKGNLARYKENPETDVIRQTRLQEELFGNENDITDALAYKEGVGYTGPSKIGEN